MNMFSVKAPSLEWEIDQEAVFGGRPPFRGPGVPGRTRVGLPVGVTVDKDQTEGLFHIQPEDVFFICFSVLEMLVS